MICWLDLETEGLDPKRDLILELGMIVTDDDLVERHRASWVLQLDPDRDLDLKPVVRQMHTASGLLAECAAAEMYVDDVEQEVLAWLYAAGVPRETQLAGSTIGFDRSFLAEQMSELLKHFHYRSIDVSTLMELARRWYPDIYAGRPGADESKKPHRALADLEHSIATLKYYRDRIFVGVSLDPDASYMRTV
jgi:oligoribonuclease